MEGTMTNATAVSTPTDQVEALIRQVAEENGLDVAAAMPAVADSTPQAESRKQEDALSQRWGLSCSCLPDLPISFVYMSRVFPVPIFRVSWPVFLPIGWVMLL